MPESLLKVEALCKSYPGFELHDICLDIEPGSIQGLVGANGAGKTTLIKSILGVIRPSTGSIKLFGEEVCPTASGFVGQTRFARLRQAIGFVPDTCAFSQELSCKSVETLCSKTFTNWDKGLFEKLLGDSAISMSKKVKDLSRGMGMKLSLACALSHHPKLLILDEATAGLDPLARDEVVGMLRSYVANDDCGILMSSHITSDLERAADRVACIERGRLVFDRTTDEICDMAGIARCSETSLQTLLNSRVYAPGELRIRRSAYSHDVLVPDRFAFAEAFPEIPVDRIGIDDYLLLSLKGDLS